jgi:hypothetical protein
MAIASNQFRLLFLTRHKSDIEYKISALFARRVGLIDQTVVISSGHSNSIFQTGNYGILYGTDTNNNGQIDPDETHIPGAPLGDIGIQDNIPYQGIGPSDIPQDPIPTGNYEHQLSIIQAMDKELEVEVQRLEMLRKAAETEVESVQKVLQKNIEKDYKTFG